MDDDTPILRADATDDDLQEEPVPKFATGGLVSGPKGKGDDSIPAILSHGCYYPIKPVHAAEDHAPGDRQHHVYGNDHTHEPE